MVATFIVYLVLVFVIGAVANKFISRGEEGYYVGDRNFGAIATAISAGSTDTSGWIFIGAVGYAYAAGISTMWMLPGFVIGYFINWIIVAPRLRRFAHRHNCLGLSDYWDKRFGDTSHLLKITSSVLIAVFFVAYMASQLTAAGKAFNSILHLDFNVAVIISAAFVFGYVVFGGYRSVVWTDVVQGIIMLVVLFFFPIYMITKLGGWGTFFNHVGHIDPILVSAGGGTVGAAAFGLIVGLVGFGIGEPGQPHIIQRFFSAKDDKAIRQGTFVAMIWVIVVMTGSNLLGLIGRVLIPQLKDPEYVFPQLVMNSMNPIVVGIVLGAIAAAIQSTFSSQLMVATQAVASDLLKSVSRRTYSEQQLLTISRYTMFVLVVLAVLLSLLNVQTVFLLVLYAWAGLGASFGPLLVLSLYWDGITRWGAFWGIISGAVVSIVWKLTPYSQYLYEIIPGMLVSLIVIVAVSKISKRVPSTVNLREEFM